MKPKILWHSNAPWAPTGYGQQTGLFVPKLNERYDMAISAFYGLEGARIHWDGIPVFPGLGGEFGNDYITDHAKQHFGGGPRDGLLFTLMDVWVLNPERIAQMNTACWVPVDHQPAPPNVLEFFHGSQAVPIAMSRFGAEQLAPFNPLYVPHAINTDVYQPHERAYVRQQVGVPDDGFLIGMVAANKGRPSRKGFQQALEAFKAFSTHHDDAYFYLHTTMNPDVSMGENLPGLITALGLRPDRVLTADQYRMLFDPYSPKTMAKIYSAMDVLVNPAAGEGFGIPVLEAQACGVPVIVTDFSAMSEVCGSGWKVESRPTWTGQNSWQVTADVGDIVQALRECYSLPRATRKELADRARRHALTYSLPRVLEEHMLPAVEAALERFEDRKPVELKVAA